eukprot:360328-Chlamydomonas_euryale.AAC.2
MLDKLEVALAQQLCACWVLAALSMQAVWFLCGLEVFVVLLLYVMGTKDPLFIRKWPKMYAFRCDSLCMHGLDACVACTGSCVRVRIPRTLTARVFHAGCVACAAWLRLCMRNRVVCLVRNAPQHRSTYRQSIRGRVAMSLPSFCSPLDVSTIFLLTPGCDGDAPAASRRLSRMPSFCAFYELCCSA